MRKPKTITIDGVEYVRADSVAAKPVGSRVIAVLDRGWIMVGYSKRTSFSNDNRGDGWVLTDCYNLRKWTGGGFGGAVLNPKGSSVVLDRCGDIWFPDRSLLQLIPISKDWAE